MPQVWILTSTSPGPISGHGNGLDAYVVHPAIDCGAHGGGNICWSCVVTCYMTPVRFVRSASFVPRNLFTDTARDFAALLLFLPSCIRELQYCGRSATYPRNASIRSWPCSSIKGFRSGRFVSSASEMTLIAWKWKAVRLGEACNGCGFHVYQRWRRRKSVADAASPSRSLIAECSHHYRSFRIDLCSRSALTSVAVDDDP